MEHVISADGSSTFYSSQFRDHYHSTHGALQESLHIFIQSGFNFLPLTQSHVSILEVGLGTGLNALLTWRAAAGRTVVYTALDVRPLLDSEVALLNYPDVLEDAGARLFLRDLHAAPWGEQVELRPGFSACKVLEDVRNFRAAEAVFDVIYFDAFAPDAQPELWDAAVFTRMRACCRPGALLLTYSCKGAVRRALTQAGFTVSKIPGPKGKREIVRAAASF